MIPGSVAAVDPDHIRRRAPSIGRAIRAWFRADVHGMERLPSTPFVAVGNHSGAAILPDTFVWLASYYAGGNDPPMVTLAHDSMFDAYPDRVGLALSRLGAIRASRANAIAALDRGYAVTCYPGGDLDACRSYARRHEIVFAGRTGYVDVAREAGVPIVPVVSAGAHEALLILWDGVPLARALGLEKSRLRLAAFPLSLSLPWGLWLGPLPGYLPLPTKVSLRVLDPVDPRDGTVEEVDRRVRAALQSALDALAARRRFPVIG